MIELSSPISVPEPWIVWDVARPDNFCTVTARTWFSACQEGRKRIGCERVDAKLESENPLGTIRSTKYRNSIRSIDTCIICTQSPCICNDNKVSSKPVQDTILEKSAEDVLCKYMQATDAIIQSKYRNIMIVMIFKKLFNL